MDSIRNLLGRRLWLAFLFHQFLIFALAFGFLNLVRIVSGRSIHGGREPVGLIDGIGLVLLSAGVVVLTIFFYRRIKANDAPPLGIGLSPRRFADLLAGLLIGGIFAAAPYYIAFQTGRMFIIDRIGAHFDNFQIVRIVTVAFFLLFAQGVMEETANRAFPMRLWQHRSLAFRLLVPSVFFAVIHLADENFSFERVAVLIMAGTVQGLAYLLTGNIWLTSGLHTGANLASFSVTGLWHAGAVVALAGEPAYPNWAATASMLVLIGGLFAVARFKNKENRPPDKKFDG